MRNLEQAFMCLIFQILLQQLIICVWFLTTIIIRKYDTGSYLRKIQPERIAYHPDEIEVRANWDVDEQFTLK